MRRGGAAAHRRILSARVRQGSAGERGGAGLTEGSVPANDNPLDAFRQVLTGASRAIEREPELELGFTADTPSASGKIVKEIGRAHVRTPVTTAHIVCCLRLE